MAGRDNSRNRRFDAATRLTPHRPGIPMHSDSAPPPPAPRVGPRPLRWILAIAAVGGGFLAARGFHSGRDAAPNPAPAGETQGVGTREGTQVPRNFPAQDTLSFQGRSYTTCYASDSLLQARAFRYVGQYRPDGAVLAICDLRTGLVRALVERDSDGMRSTPRLALVSRYPAASLVKIVTAAAEFEWGGGQPSDSMPMLGRGHTLYRFQLRPPERGSTPKVSLEQAFARSINPVFGQLGLKLGAAPMRKMGAALGFNSPRPLSPGDSSRFTVPDTGYALAETACGFTTTTTISPLHALEIARGLGDDGRILPLSFTSEIRDAEGHLHPLPAPVCAPAVSPATLAKMQALMAATVAAGTARKGFLRNLRRAEWDKLEMGGKTGSLDGPVGPQSLAARGRYEWYIGYARLKERPDEGIALAIMLINERTLAVHATELASLLIRDWAWARLKETRGAAGYAVR